MEHSSGSEVSEMLAIRVVLVARRRREILAMCAETKGRPNGPSLTGSAAPAGGGGLGSADTALEGTS